MSEKSNNENLHGTDTSETADVIDEGEYLEWLKFSQMDYSSAKYLFDSPLHPRPWRSFATTVSNQRKKR